MIFQQLDFQDTAHKADPTKAISDIGKAGEDDSKANRFGTLAKLRKELADFTTKFNKIAKLKFEADEWRRQGYQEKSKRERQDYFKLCEDCNIIEQGIKSLQEKVAALELLIPLKKIQINFLKRTICLGCSAIK